MLFSDPPPPPPPPAQMPVSLKFQAKKSEISFSYFLRTACCVKTIQTLKSGFPRRPLAS